MSCSKPCGNGCKDFIGNEVEWTQIRSLNCNDYQYLANLEKDLERAKCQKDILRVVALAKEISRIKTLCGDTNPTIQRVERALGMARNRLGLQTCRVIQRSLEPNKPEPKKTMIGFGNFYEIHENPDGSKTLSLPEKPPKPTPPQNPIHESELRWLSRNQNNIKERKKNEQSI